MSLLLLFLIGAAYDYVLVLWTRLTVARSPAFASLLSMWLGGASILGMGAALHGWRQAVALILGYGAGTFLSVR